MVETLTLPVFGMTCNGCVQSIYNALNAIVGVQKVEVNLPLQQAIVEYDSIQVNKADLLEAIEDAGFSTQKDH